MHEQVDAAVALVHHDDALLFIRRPHRDDDRWSGHIAFPGGLAQPGEAPAETAARETFEEVGLPLGAPTGALSDKLTLRPARLRLMRIRPLLFEAPDRALTLDPREVEEAFWVPRARLDRLPVVPALRRAGPLVLPVPTIDLDGRVLWGLTLSMVLELRR